MSQNRGGQGKAGEAASTRPADADPDASTRPADELDKRPAEDLPKIDEALAEQLKRLDQKVRRLEGKLGRWREGKGQARFVREVDELGEDVNRRLARLQDELEELEAARRMRGRLARLRRKASEAQNRLLQRTGAIRTARQNKQRGGLRAGKGTSDRKSDKKVKSEGKTTRLTGQKGEGPSLTTVEAASSGTGVSRRRGKKQQVKFQRQVESFVEREDVPPALRDGVKRYFENIQTDWQRDDTTSQPRNDG